MRVARLRNLRECKSDGLGVSCAYPLELQPHATKHDCTVRENKRAPSKQKKEETRNKHACRPAGGEGGWGNRDMRIVFEPKRPAQLVLKQSKKPVITYFILCLLISYFFLSVIRESYHQVTI